MSEWKKLERAKIKAREQINSLPPKQAQVIINEVICADMWQPDTSQPIDWGDSLPIPKSMMQDEENS